MAKHGDNLYKRKDGRWEGRYIKSRVQGHIQYGYVFAATRDEAREKLDAAIAGLTQAGPRIPFSASADPGSFCELANDWLEFQKPQLKLTSINKYTNMLNSYLLPELGTLQMTQINRTIVSAMLCHLLCAGGQKQKGLTPRTVTSVYTILKSVFDYARREKDLAVVDISGIPIKQTQKELRVLSQTEQDTLSRFLCANPDPCHLGILVCLYTGLRIGEICALRWQDISFDEHLLYVNRAMQRVQLLDSRKARTEVRVSTPKSDCSIRKIPLPDELLRLLTAQRSEAEAFLLTGTDKRYMEPRTLQNRFHIVLKKCELRDVNFHTLRHTFATRCVELGFDVKSLSEILGHANVNITMNRYVHPSMDWKKQNMNMLSKLFPTAETT